MGAIENGVYRGFFLGNYHCFGQTHYDFPHGGLKVFLRVWVLNGFGQRKRSDGETWGPILTGL